MWQVHMGNRDRFCYISYWQQFAVVCLTVLTFVSAMAQQWQALLPDLNSNKVQLYVLLACVCEYHGWTETNPVTYQSCNNVQVCALLYLPMCDSCMMVQQWQTMLHIIIIIIIIIVIIMSVFLERLSMWNMLNCAEQGQIQKYKTCVSDTQNSRSPNNHAETSS